MKTTPEHPRTNPDIAERIALVPYAPTLNGKAARVTGFANKFATVTEIESGLSAEWSWEAVRIVMDNGGNFQS